MATADSEPAVNPNEDDVPREQQVMSPTVATARGRDGNEDTPVLNGNHPPLRGDQDMDGETMLSAAATHLAEPLPRATGPSTTTEDSGTSHEAWRPSSGCQCGYGVEGRFSWPTACFFRGRHEADRTQI